MVLRNFCYTVEFIFKVKVSNVISKIEILVKLFVVYNIILIFKFRLIF